MNDTTDITVNSDDKPTMEQRWSIISLSLDKAGIDCEAIPPLMRAAVIAQVEADEVIGADEDVWREFAEYLVEEHPRWAHKGFWRRNNAQKMLDEFSQEPWGAPSADLDTLAAGKYAVVVYMGDHHNHYVAAAADKKGIAQVFLDCMTTDGDQTEYTDEIMDLDTGEYITVNTSTVITVVVDGEEATYAS